MAKELLDLLFGSLGVWNYISDRPSNLANIYTLKKILELRATCTRSNVYLIRRDLPPPSWIGATKLLGTAHRSLPKLADALGMSVPAVKGSLRRLWRTLFIAIDIAGETLLPEQQAEFLHFLDKVAIEIRIRLNHLPACNVIQNHFAGVSPSGDQETRYHLMKNRPMTTKAQGTSAFAVLIEITRDFAIITKTAHLDMAPPGRPIGLPLWQAAYPKDLQNALEGLRMEVWALAASLDLLPGSSATEWNALGPASPWVPLHRQEAPGRYLINYVCALSRDDDGSLSGRKTNRPLPTRDD